MRTLLNVLFTGFVLSAIYWYVVRPWHSRWGAADDEIHAPLPGDSIAANATTSVTHAITIYAPAEAIWPWLMQIGQEKGGMYSYDWLENLIGCNIHSVDRIVPDWQSTSVGDAVRMGPKGYPLFKVVEIIPNKAFILQAADPKTEVKTTASWAFVLQPQGPGQTRLIVRSRNQYEPSIANFIIWRVITEPAQFLMEQKMLRRLKQLAESTPVQQAA